MLISIPQLTKNWFEKNNIPILFIETTESTNLLARNDSNHFEVHTRAYLTSHQTKGRGRNENQWVDNSRDKNLLISYSFSWTHPPQHLTGPLLGLALFKSAQSIWPTVSWSLKAPNDLYIQDKKVAGLLTESINQGSKGRLIIGLGFNIFDAPKELENSGQLVSSIGITAENIAEKWTLFLAELLLQFQWALQESQKSTLSSNSREALLKALNANPIKNQILIDISENADLITSSETIYWTSL